jgi:hypothetical protein
MSIKQRFATFISNIKPTATHLDAAVAQTDYMRQRLHDVVAADGSFKLEKILLAGSNAKHTSLLRTDDNVFDVDLGAYFSGTGATRDELSTLLEFTEAKLYDIYKGTKERQDFETLSSCVRVKFKSGIKLWVDVAPIIRDETLKIDDAGWIPRDDGWRLTSVTAHNNFVRSRNQFAKTRSGPVTFNGLVRMMKWWRNLQDESICEMMPALFIESIVAAALDDIGGVTPHWQTSFRAIFAFLRRHALQAPIIFADHSNPADVKLPHHKVIVLDSVNEFNNVTSRWTNSTRLAFMEAVNSTFDSIIDAWSAEEDGDEDDAVAIWCEVFGPAFAVLSLESDAA